MRRFQALFGPGKPVIAMIHLGALPGTPLHDDSAGVEAIIAGAAADLAALQAAGVDAVMFGNENDRPYELKVDTASTATMAYVIGRLRERIAVPFGVNVLWDPMATMALGSLLVAIAYKYGPASLVTPLAGAYPVVTLGFAWAVLEERPTWLQWGGIAAVLAGMVLTTAVSDAA